MRVIPRVSLAKNYHFQSPLFILKIKVTFQAAIGVMRQELFS